MRNEQFETDIKVIPTVFNTLSIIYEGGESILKGQLPIVDSNGKQWDTFQIEIKGSYRYPYSFPKLFETANAFPHNADWHVYENDFSCCVDVLPNELLLCKKGLNVVDYLKQFVIPYFANQSFRMREGYYLYGEYSHGIFGRIEFYQSKLKAKNLHELIQMLYLIVKEYIPDRRAYCPFCNKTKFRKCHKTGFEQLSAIKDFIFFDISKELIPFFKAFPNFQLSA